MHRSVSNWVPSSISPAGIGCAALKWLPTAHPNGTSRMVDATLLATGHPSKTCKQQPVHTMLQELLQPCMSFADRSNAEARKCCVPSVEMRASVVHTASCVPSAYKPTRNKSAVAFGISCENSESSPLHMVQSFCRQCMYDVWPSPPSCFFFCQLGKHAWRCTCNFIKLSLCGLLQAYYRGQSSQIVSHKLSKEIGRAHV